MSLGRLLDVPRTSATGLLVALWCWALDNAPDGVLGSESDEDIAAGGDWDGDPAVFVEALISSGFIDREGDALHIHDWHDYAGKLMDRRKADASRKRKLREKASAGRPPPVRRTSTPRVEQSRVEVSSPPLVPPARDNWTCPAWWEPLKPLHGYIKRHYSGTVDKIEAVCTEAGVDPKVVVEMFAVYYAENRILRGWSNPVSALTRTLPLQIKIALNGSRPQATSSVMPLSDVEGMKAEAERMRRLTE